MTRFFTAGESLNPQQFSLALPCVYSGISEQWHLVVTAPFKYKSTVLHAQTDEKPDPQHSVPVTLTDPSVSSENALFLPAGTLEGDSALDLDLKPLVPSTYAHSRAGGCGEPGGSRVIPTSQPLRENYFLLKSWTRVTSATKQSPRRGRLQHALFLAAQARKALSTRSRDAFLSTSQCFVQALPLPACIFKSIHLITDKKGETAQIFTAARRFP